MVCYSCILVGLFIVIVLSFCDAKLLGSIYLGMKLELKKFRSHRNLIIFYDFLGFFMGIAPLVYIENVLGLIRSF